jgi:hypothetical protein
MIAMCAVQDDWISVEDAAKAAGCSPQYIRRLLDRHLDETTKRTAGCVLDGWKVNGKAWTVLKTSAEAMRGTLTSRARMHEGARVAKKTARRTASKKAKRRRS